MHNETIDDPYKRWFYGVLIPVFALFPGIQGLLTKHFTISTHFHTSNIDGGMAVATSIGIIAVAAFFHAFYFWGDDDTFQ